MTDNIMSCDRFDELLPEYLEGTLDAGTRANVEMHLAGCQRCASLIADLNSITEAAGSLPDLSPSKDLWTGIADRIAAPVISLPSERERHAVRYQRLRMVAGAAALVVMTATLTFVGTKSFVEARNEAAPRTVGSAEPVPMVPGQQPFRDTVPSSERPVAPPTEAAPSTGQPATAPAVEQRRPRTPGAANVALTATERAYDREISQLQALLGERRRELDPKTVQVIERNLLVIDEAIRQSREALQRDPASRFLNDQLNNALDRKVELLRSAAMLPSSI
jgi:hypothetical protein